MAREPASSLSAITVSVTFRSETTALETVRQSYLEQNSLGDFIQPESIARMVLFLCSAAGSQISGQALSVDGDTDSLRTRH